MKEKARNCLLRVSCSLALLLGCSLAFQPASASEDEASIVVNASRATANDEPISGTVIARGEIVRADPASLTEVLDLQSGIRAFDKRGPGGGPYLSIRGGEPNHTAVLIEGAQVGDPTSSTGGGFDFALLAPEVIGRVEINRSGFASVGGPYSLAGSVGVTLRDLGPDERLVGARAAIDTQGYFSGDATLGTAFGDGDLVLAGGWMDTGNLVPDSDLSRWHTLVKLRQELGALKLRLAAIHAEAEKEAFPEDSGGPRVAVNRERETRDLTFDLLAGTAVLGEPESGQIRIVGNWQRHHNMSDTPAIADGVFSGVPAIFADTVFERATVTADASWRPFEAVTLVVGGGIDREDGESEGTVDFGVLIPSGFETSRSIRSVFTEVGLVPAEGMELVASARHDDPSTSDGRWSWRTAARVGVLPDFFVSGSVSRSEKLPSLYALAFPLIANPDLLPERSRSIDIGLEYRGEKSEARITYFDNRYRDLVDFDPVLFTNVNRGKVTARGVEGELRFAASDTLEASLSATYLDTTNFDGPPLRSRPKWQFAGHMRWQAAPRLSLHGSLAHVGEQFDSSIATGRVVLDDYLQAEFAANYRLGDTLTLRLAGTNLFDDYENAVGFPVSRRALRLTARIEG